MARVFISFINEDKEVAQSLQDLIAFELGLPGAVFLSADRRQIYGGDIWLEKIRGALESCEVLVMILSKRALQRSWVNFEAGAVWLSRKPVIPACCGNISKHALPHPYSSMQALNLNDPKDTGYLIESVHHHLRLPDPAPMSPYLMGLTVITGHPDQQEIQERLNRYERVIFTANRLQDEP